MAKSACEKLRQTNPPKEVVVEKAFAGIAAGKRLFIATPMIVADYISAIPPGEVRTIPQLRDDLAKGRRCDATCPLTTSIFIRIAAEAALEDLDDGQSVDRVIPFWRVGGPDDKIAKKLTVDRTWIAERRAAELSGG